jgi:hypothetical protein
MKQILITGLPRSGTTLLGNLLGSCDGVEYFFEPPLMNSILNNLAPCVDDNLWVQLYEDYRDYELLQESIAGRRLNFNSHDDTYVRNIIPGKEIDKRLGKSWRSHEIETRRINSVFCFKTPSLGKGIELLRNKYSDLKILVLIRDTPSVIKSIKIKGWFNESINTKIRDVIIYENQHIPSIVPSHFHNKWSLMSEDEKIIIYMYSQYKVIDDLKGLIFVDFNELISGERYFNTLIEYLRVGPGEKTKILLSGLIRKPIIKQDISVFGEYTDYYHQVECMKDDFLTKKF